MFDQLGWLIDFNTRIRSIIDSANHSWIIYWIETDDGINPNICFAHKCDSNSRGISIGDDCLPTWYLKKFQHLYSLQTIAIS